MRTFPADVQERHVSLEQQCTDSWHCHEVWWQYQSYKHSKPKYFHFYDSENIVIIYLDGEPLCVVW